jgi:hypothetical protein
LWTWVLRKGRQHHRNMRKGGCDCAYVKWNRSVIIWRPYNSQSDYFNLTTRSPLFTSPLIRSNSLLRTCLYEPQAMEYHANRVIYTFGALKSDSTHHFFRNACTKSLRFSQFSGCWLILSVYILMSFDFPFVRLFGVR